MRFMAVQGVGYWTEHWDPPTLHILVTGDDRVRITTIRDERVRALMGLHEGDLDWQVDQYTQETIGVTLAEQGWEVVSTTEGCQTGEAVVGTSPVYLVRQ